ncbi:MAG: S8 family serine peptidase [Anaerolineae bacterium]
MRSVKWARFAIIFVLLLSLTPVAAQGPSDKLSDVPLFASEGNWYIVQLDKPSLAAYAQSGTGQISTTGLRGGLDVNAAASQTYIGQLEQDQALFAQSMAGAIPGAQVGYDYQIVLNALAVKLPDSRLETLLALRNLPGVKRISAQRIYTVELDYSLPLIDAPALWSQLGGRDEAGSGIKVGVIDSGIDPDHPMFDGTGWSYPATGTWPKGYCASDPSFCNAKIISARYYTPTLTVNPAEVLTPQDLHGHGSHTAGTAAGNRVTASYGTSTPEISGVAPGAWIMAYKALFLNQAGTSASGSNIMLAAAVEDAIADGADVLNNSWGGTAWELDDPLAAAYEAAVDAGVVVVFSAGNSGPDYGTVGSPTSGKFIEVGASTTARAYYNALAVTAPTPVSATLQSFAGNQFADIAPAAMPTTTVGPLPYLPCDLTGVPDLGLAGVTVGITETAPYASGWIALIPRGTHDFTLKLGNAIAQGASAAVMYTDDRTWKGGFTASNLPIYTVMTDHSLGLQMRDWWVTHTSDARLQIGYPMAPFPIETPDVIADFSSRGPTLALLIKPDVVAPGVNILSAVADGTYDSWNGTSMAAPHVTGAAALLQALHPAWTPAQVKSALMTTASQTILDLDQVTTADVMTQGAGRIDLGSAGDPGLTFDMPSLSFGMVEMGSSGQIVISAADVSGAAETYTLSVDEHVADTGAVTVTVTPATLDVGAGGTAVFTVTVETSGGATAQDVEGNVVLTGSGHEAHLPYWARISPPAADVLLIDDDLSGLVTGATDYRTYYTDTLATRGAPFDVWDSAALGFPTRDVLDRYDTLVYFGGDEVSYFFYDYFYGLGGGTSEDLQAYLAGGGKMIAFGQDVTWGMTYVGTPFELFFGGAYSADNAFGNTPIPRPSAVGVASFLQGTMVDFASGGNGAGNMNTVDSLSVPAYSDVSNIPLFAVPNTFADTQGAGYVGSAMSSDLTLERDADPIGSEWFHLGYRATFCSFGLEGVNEDTGYATRAAVLDAMFAYVDDQPAVAFDAASYSAPQSFAFVDFSATMTSTVGADVVAYRWDFGDGSSYVTTSGPAASHQYQTPGPYLARVEVTDEYGHTAVSDPVRVAVGHLMYLPFVARN